MMQANLANGFSVKSSSLAFQFIVFASRMKLVTFVVLTALVAALASNANAWGSEGHEVVANLAAAQLTPRAKAEVASLLALEPGETLESISTWADEHKNPSSAPWHYINFPRDNCVYDRQRDCPDGKCVVEAIERHLGVLSSTSSPEKRLQALKYVVHLVADVHQPLHAGFRDDKGGNRYQLQAFMRGSNLHALWDSGLIRNLNEDVEVLAERLLTKPVPTGIITNLTPENTAEESCRIVSELGFYPERRVGADYIEKFTPIVERRLVIAGARLAAMLNNALK
jgi:hypothetical protein